MYVHPMSEADWQASEDAYTLLRAKEIQKDEIRMNKALDWVKKIKDEKAEEIKAANDLLND